MSDITQLTLSGKEGKQDHVTDAAMKGSTIYPVTFISCSWSDTVWL